MNYVTNIERWRAVGYRFSLVLSREITDDETAVLKEAACAGPVFTTDSHPVNADVTVTKMDFDDTISPSLAEAIESALAAMKGVSDLSVPGLSVPAQPAQNPVEETAQVIEGTVIEGTVIEGTVIEGTVAEEESRPEQR